jgi:ubiquinone biosynthesis protein UbiJ
LFSQRDGNKQGIHIWKTSQRRWKQTSNKHAEDITEEWKQTRNNNSEDNTKAVETNKE